MTEIELLTGGNYFKAHPQNILGVEAKGTTKWGEEITIVKKDSSIAEIAKRIIADGINPEPQPWHLDRSAPELSTRKFTATDREKRIAEAIAKTKEQIQHPPVTTGIELVGFNELQKRYGNNITEAEMQVWVWYQRGRMFSDSAILNPDNGWSKFVVPLAQIPEKRKEWLKAGLVCFDGKEYLPSVLFYAGNIYQRIETIKRNEQAITTEIGKEGFERQMNGLQEAMPKPLKLLAEKSERLFITPIDPFCNNFRIGQLSDGTVFDEEVTLVFAFEQWMETLTEQDFTHGSNSFEVSNRFIRRERFPNDTPVSEKIAIKRRAQQDGLALFSLFLYEALTREDQQILEHLWNTEYNSYAEYDYSKIPVGFEINKWFKNAPIDPRPALWDGVRFLTVNGSGTVAFDVGVGKTMTAILAMAQALYTGQCKRPLVIVPNPTYKKWISETVGEFNADGTVKVHGVLPQYKDRINDFYNLGVNIENELPARWPKDYTITFITYEGLMKLGLSQKVRDQLGEELFTILQQGNLEDRDRQKLREDIDSIVGTLNSEVIANFDDLGFDYVVCDEAHNFKKIFTRVQGRKNDSAGKKESSPYQLDSGEPSARGLKLFALTQYVLRQNSMRNVVLLTATPFTNSPLEIYSMLALTSYQLLQERGITNLIDFFDKFINEENELSITIKGKFEAKPVIKTFHNRIVLQSIIFNSIIYKTGEEAGVPRPIKVVYPWVKDERGILLSPDKRIDSSLRPTADQERWLREIARFANEEKGNAIEGFVPRSYYDDRNKLQGRVLIAINLAKMCTLSPYLMKVGGEENGVSIYEKENPDYKEFIKSSPKLTYVMDCIKTVREWHTNRGEAVSGQIIYMNMATGYFPMIKEYLVKQVGYDAKEVEIIIGGISQEKKERIKDKFLNGEVKIIIGSATIKEGIDLQTRTTVLYNCNMDWNPTDIKQLEGRAWRQGNIHSYVRIVTPLIENSLDVFLFQKLEEKTSRINDIWYRSERGNVLKLEDFDPAELKMGLMTDPEERVKAEIELEVTKLETRKAVANGTVKRITEAQEAISEITDAGRSIDGHYQDGKKELSAVLKEYQIELTNEELSNTKRAEFESKERTLSELLSRDLTEKTKIAVVKRYAKYLLSKYSSNYGYSPTASKAYSLINMCDNQLKRFSELESVQKNLLEPKGLTMADDLQPVIDEANREAVEVAKEIERYKSKEYTEQRVNQVREEMQAKKALSKSIDERVKEFTRQNYLLSCLKGVHICTLDNALIGEVNKIKVEPSPAPDVSGNYYVSAVKYGSAQTTLLLGPFKFHPEAEKWVDKATTIAKEKFNKSGDATWASYGTVKMADDYTKPGILNEYMPEAFNNSDKAKRLRIAKAKAAALKLKLQLQEPLKEAA